MKKSDLSISFEIKPYSNISEIFGEAERVNCHRTYSGKTTCLNIAQFY